MGSFTNTDQVITINNISSGVLQKIQQSPFYSWLDKKPTTVTFYNVDTSYSTLDEGGTKQIYQLRGADAPLRYDKITGVLLYGIQQMEVDLENGEFGMEASDITGEAVLPPNTFRPMQDSFFVISYLSKNYVFRVTKVTFDTLENSANFYKIDFILDKTGKEVIPEIESRVVKEFTFISGNVGTAYKAVIENSDLDMIENLEAASTTLKKYYIALFFKSSLQTFVFRYQDAMFYNPEVIEFIIRNKLLDYDDEYIFVDQAVWLPKTFVLEYDKSIYKQIEDCDPNIGFRRYYGILNKDPNSLLSTRLEEYYIISPLPKMGILAEPIQIYMNELIGGIIKNQKYVGNKAFINIISNYFNDKKPITQKMLDTLEDIDFHDTTTLTYIYHILPMLIYIIDKEISNRSSNDPSSSVSPSADPIQTTLEANSSINTSH